MMEDRVTRPPPPPLPPIRVDDEVTDSEPRIEIGKKKAALPPPVPFNPREA